MCGTSHDRPQLVEWTGDLHPCQARCPRGMQAHTSRCQPCTAYTSNPSPICCRAADSSWTVCHAGGVTRAHAASAIELATPALQCENQAPIFTVEGVGSASAPHCHGQCFRRQPQQERVRKEVQFGIPTPRCILHTPREQLPHQSSHDIPATSTTHTLQPQCNPRMCVRRCIHSFGRCTKFSRFAMATFTLASSGLLNTCRHRARATETPCSPSRGRTSMDARANMQADLT